MAVVVLVGALAVGGCGNGGSTPDADPAEPGVAAATAASPSTPPAETHSAPTTDGSAACEGFFDGDESLLDRTLETVLAAAESLDEPLAREMAQIAEEIDDLLEIAPTDVSSPLRQIQLPFNQVADALRAGGGQLTINTASARDGIPALMEACLNYDYRMNQDS